MSKEQFNPSNPKFKKVEDLPEEERKNFADVKGGGFVRKEAKDLYDNAVRRVVGDIMPMAFQEMIMWLEQKWGGNKMENKLKARHNEKIDLNIGRIIDVIIHEASNDHLDALMQVAKSPEEKKVLLKRFIDDFFTKASNEAVDQLLQPGKAILEAAGHSGQLYWRDCRTDGCMLIYGKFDGQGVDIHTRSSASIGDKYLTAQERSLFWQAYFKAAVPEDAPKRVRQNYEKIKSNLFQSAGLSDLPDDMKGLAQEKLPKMAGGKTFEDVWAAAEEYAKVLRREKEDQAREEAKKEEERKEKEAADLAIFRKTYL